MKRNFFKNSLAAFAFTLAIVASFAFTPVQDEPLPVDGYLQITNPSTDCVDSIDTCYAEGSNACEVTTNPNGSDKTVYGIDGGTTCSVPLFRDPTL